MAHVFRLHTTGSNSLADWTETTALGTNDIDSIKDPDLENVENEITSIPSPFARIDLVKNAFRYVNNQIQKNPNGSQGTKFHKMVSDTLDVAEIFFNYKKFRNLFTVITWDRNTAIGQLKSSRERAQKEVGETLDMFLNADAKTYNFDRMQRIHILVYRGPGALSQLEVVGGTSPATLFFSTANDLKYISQYVSFDGHDKPFDGAFAPLNKRDPNFIKYLFALRASYPSFAADFPEFNDYMNLIYGKLGTNLQNDINALTPSSITAYPMLAVNNVNIDILDGLTFNENGVEQTPDPDFRIVSNAQAPLPLALPQETGTVYNNLKYVSGTKWNGQNKVPYEFKTPIPQRDLPFIGNVKYPWLCVSDLLTDTIIRTPYPMNESAYFTGGYRNDNETDSYLLPLTETFFKLFTADDILSGKVKVLIDKLAGGVTVTLKIPIQGNNMIKEQVYTRRYVSDVLADAENNKGAVVTATFGIGIMPLVEQATNTPGRIALFDKSLENNVCLSFFDNTEKVDAHYHKRGDKGPGYCSIETYAVSEKFNTIAVSFGATLGYIIPKPKNVTQNAKFKFAVDFGTTNTHIEYSVNGNPSQPFDITPSDIQMQRLHKTYESDYDIERAFTENFVPEIVGNGDFSFPIRSVFAPSSKINFNQPYFTLAEGNIAFNYGKYLWPDYDGDPKINLKWTSKDKEYLELYIQNICYLLMSKVLLNNGVLEDTEIVWFYPASMIKANLNRLADIWNNAYATYFSNKPSAITNNVTKMTESIAPYFYFKKQQGANPNVITIDIGGGTSDIFYVQHDTPQLLSSFRFAANSIFGDGYGWNSDNNGFVKKFLSDFDSVLGANDKQDIQAALRDIARKKNSSEICSFFFSLNDSQKSIPALDFNKKLSNDEDLKYVFFLFYSLLVYFVAMQMKAKGLDLPQTLAFSGNGAKTLHILSSDLPTLAGYFSKIFESVLGKEYASNALAMQLILEDEPKEATCKGGLLGTPVDTSLIQDTLLGIDGSTSAINKHFSEIKDAEMNMVVNEVVKAIETIEKMDKASKISEDNFGANGKLRNGVYDFCHLQLKTYLERGINIRKEDLTNWESQDDIIGETMFFYPIVELLHGLALGVTNQTIQ